MYLFTSGRGHITGILTAKTPLSASCIGYDYSVTNLLSSGWIIVSHGRWDNEQGWNVWNGYKKGRRGVDDRDKGIYSISSGGLLTHNHMDPVLVPCAAQGLFSVGGTNVHHCRPWCASWGGRRIPHSALQSPNLTTASASATIVTGGLCIIGATDCAAQPQQMKTTIKTVGTVKRGRWGRG